MSALTGLWIPLEYLRNAWLSRNELVIISYVKYRLDQGVFKGSHVEISAALKLKNSRVSESISALFQKGFLERTTDPKHYILSEKYLNLAAEKVTGTVNISGSVKFTESVTKSYGKRTKTITESVYPSYIEKVNKIDNDNNVEIFLQNGDLKKEKSAKVSSKKSALPELEFLQSEFSDFGVFQDYIRQAHPEIDASFYYHKISAWIDKNTGELAKRKIWKSTVQQFLENDYKKGELVTTKAKGYGKPTNSNYSQPTNRFEQAANAEELDDLISQYFAEP